MNCSDGYSRIYKKNRFFIVITWIKFMVSINTWWKKCVKLHKRKNIWYLQFWCEKPVICSFPNKLKSTSGVGFGFLSLNWNRVLIKFSKKVGQAVIEICLHYAFQYWPQLACLEFRINGPIPGFINFSVNIGSRFLQRKNHPKHTWFCLVWLTFSPIATNTDWIHSSFIFRSSLFDHFYLTKCFRKLLNL